MLRFFLKVYCAHLLIELRQKTLFVLHVKKRVGVVLGGGGGGRSSVCFPSKLEPRYPPPPPINFAQLGHKALFLLDLVHDICI